MKIGVIGAGGRLGGKISTEALDRGMDVTAIQQLLGHENISTTQIYAAMNEDVIRHQYNKYVAN